MRNFQMSLYALMLVIVSLFMFGCGDNEPIDSRGADVPQSQCPSLGSVCYGEGSVCSTNVCHCGYWYPQGSSAAYQACTKPIPQETCFPGRSCAAGSSCTTLNGEYVDCYCGVLATASMKQHMDCDGNQSPGTGGSGGSYNPGTGGSSGTPSGGTNRMLIQVNAMATHIYCEGAQVAFQDHQSDNVTKFYEWWHSFGCDAYSPNGPGTVAQLSYACHVDVPKGVGERFQCYINIAGSLPAGDTLKYTCARYDSGVTPPFNLFNVTTGGSSLPIFLVDNQAPGQGAYNCQVDIQ